MPWIIGVISDNRNSARYFGPFDSKDEADKYILAREEIFAAWEEEVGEDSGAEFPDAETRILYMNQVKKSGI